MNQRSIRSDGIEQKETVPWRWQQGHQTNQQIKAPSHTGATHYAAAQWISPTASLCCRTREGCERVRVGHKTVARCPRKHRSCRGARAACADFGAGERGVLYRRQPAIGLPRFFFLLLLFFSFLFFSFFPPTSGNGGVSGAVRAWLRRPVRAGALRAPG